MSDEPLGRVREEDEDEEEVEETVESKADGEEGDGHEGGDGGVAEEAEAEGGHVASAHWTTQPDDPHLTERMMLTMLTSVR